MPVTAFGYDASAIYERHSDVWILDDVGGTNWFQLGSIAELDFNAEAKTQGEDTHGREPQTGMNVTCEFAMKQTSYATEIANLDALVAPATNGHHIKITDCGVTEGATQTETDTNVAAAAGIELTGVNFNAGLQLNFKGEASTIPVSFKGSIPMSEVVKIGNSAVSLLTC